MMITSYDEFIDLRVYLLIESSNTKIEPKLFLGYVATIIL